MYGKKKDSFACLALAEVALGKELEMKQSDWYLSKAKLEKVGCDSTWGQGNMAPSGVDVTKEGLCIPNGKLGPTKAGSVLRYDEKIVYDSNQFCIRYLVVVKMRT